ncbi:uncharacterized protein LOC128916492 isoform X1 [Rissa tridactyla]|uniref:uncharacterized protein LOC128916492 isoform X1 n=1 Tax=Rissa tridactyla TaxID=75485 RepID=UPI0023BA9C0E|nr:uncharacterized protein LOC128916492 isoform X1 [Rissa tridactyla]
MLPGGHEDAELHRLTQEGALPQRSMVHREEKPGLPLCRKVCYAIGGIPYQMTGNAIGFFLQIFLLDVVQMEPLHASLIIFLGRAWDAVTDPAIGFLVSKSPRRKYGKLVPWIACSMPFGVLCYCMMWSTLSDATPASLKFLWYLFMYSFFQTCMTCHHVPYSSLTMFLGGTQRDRDSATAYRMGMEVFSTLLGSGIQGQIVGRYHTRTMNSCYVSNETLSNTSTYSLTDSLENTRRAYIFASLVLGSIYCLSCLILIFGVREQPDHTGDLCLLLYSCRGAGWEVPALSTYYVGHSFPVYSLLAVVFGEIWKENSSVTGSGGSCMLDASDLSSAIQLRERHGEEGRAVHHACKWLGNSLLIRHMSRLLPCSACQQGNPIWPFCRMRSSNPIEDLSPDAFLTDTTDPAFQFNHSAPLPSITIPSLPVRKVLLSVSACPGRHAAPHRGQELIKCVGKGGAWPLVGADRCKLSVSSRKAPCAFVSLPLAAAADHPSPGGRHPGDAQLPGLHLPGDHGRLQHGCALPFTMVSRGTSEPLVRWRGGEGYRESTTHDVPRLPICSIQQLLGCRGTCGIGTGKGCGCDTWSPSGIIQSVFGFSSKTPVTAQGAVFLLFF